MIPKDADFRDGFFLKKTPKKLIKVDLGNISNQELIDILDSHLSDIEKLLRRASFLIELGKDDSKFTEGELSS